MLFQAEGLATDHLDIFMGVVQEVDSYIRAWRSDRLARALLPHPAHIIGRGWEYLSELPRKAEFFAPVPAHEFLKKSMDYRILANSSPLWRHGIHERAYMGIWMGGVSLTDRTESSDFVFAGLPNYVGFDWNDDLNDVIITAFSRAEGDNADYFPAAEQALYDRVLAVQLDYLSQLINALEGSTLLHVTFWRSADTENATWHYAGAPD